MFKVTIKKANIPNNYKWYDDLEKAKYFADIIIKNKDCDSLIIENTKTKQVLLYFFR